MPNKITRAVREMTMDALEQLGGVAYLVELGRTEPAVFGGLLRRCIPQAIEAKVDRDLPLLVLSQSYTEGKTTEREMTSDEIEEDAAIRERSRKEWQDEH